MCTDLSLSPQQILTFYQKRWPIEVDNYFVKQLLGLGDFRVQSYEAIEKWFAIIFLVYTFLQWRLNHTKPDERFKVVAALIRAHRQQHARHVLEAACKLAVACEDVTEVLQRLVDDVPANLIALEAVLDDPAYNLVRAHSGDEALKKLLKQDFAVILMKVSLPDMDGFETAQLIRSHKKTHGIPIVFITGARRGLELVSRSYDLNDIDYIIRPFDPEILKTKVAVLVDLQDKTDANARLKLEIAERIRAEVALIQAGAALARLNDKLELNNRDLQEFAYIASHDLQEPLRKVQAVGDRLAKKYSDELGEIGQDYLNRMLAASHRMQILINDLLSLSRVSTHAQSFTEVDLNTIVDAVLSDLEHQIERTGAHMEIGELLTIQADATQITQLLKNLISNAFKFHHEKRPPHIKVSAVIQGESCQLSIEDNGIGFDIQYLDRIFKPFQRLHGRTEYEGSGMGLAICRQIVERHGGNIIATSTPGERTTFLVTLPLYQAEEINKKEGINE